ncbi:MAG: type IV-A pilus assembly ATPase PilB [Candidatus Sumerlaeia bacterium]
MPPAMERRLGQLLVKDNIITADDLERALSQQEVTGHSLGKLLTDMGITTEWEIAAALGKQLNVPFITLSHYEIDNEVISAIPREIAKKYKIVPVDKSGDTLTIALSDPSNIYILDELRLLTKCQIIPVISFESDIIAAINRYYGEEESHLEEMIKDITEQDDEIHTIEQIEDIDAANEDLEVDAEDAPVIQLVNLIISEAIKNRASDIHIEPYEKTLRLRYRIDGLLQEMTPPPKKMQNAIISRIKIMANLDIAEKRLPQDGRFKVKVQNRTVDFRVSVCPVSFGEKVVIRLLDQENIHLTLEDLGFEPHVLEKFYNEIFKPWGMVLVTGPTGSGKSTTLYTALQALNSPTKNIMTIEDPVEYQVRGINQVQARPEIGLTFAAGLRSFLRQDPDIILVGEIRDLETAEIAIKAALTGHLVMSTLHTNDAPSSMTRLTNMGIEPFLVTASLNMVVAQRLVRRVCGDCQETYTPPKELLAKLGIDNAGDLQYVKGIGCQRCRGTGYRGRMALYEVMVVSERLREAMLAGAHSGELKRIAIEEGMESLRMAGIQKIIQNKTTIEEVLAVTVAD